MGLWEGMGSHGQRDLRHQGLYLLPLLSFPFFWGWVAFIWGTCLFLSFFFHRVVGACCSPRGLGRIAAWHEGAGYFSWDDSFIPPYAAALPGCLAAPRAETVMDLRTVVIGLWWPWMVYGGGGRVPSRRHSDKQETACLCTACSTHIRTL